MWYLLSQPDGHFVFLGESSLNGILSLASISYISAKPASYKVGLLSLKISYIVRTVNMESLEHSELIGDINNKKKKSEEEVVFIRDLIPNLKPLAQNYTTIECMQSILNKMR